MGLATRLIALRNTPGLRRIAREWLYIYGCDIPPHVKIGAGLRVEHRGIGLVLHSLTEIGDDVVLYHGVTVGRARLSGPVGRTIIGDRVVIGAGAVILTGETDRRIGSDSVIGANSVVTCDVPPGEVWVGMPARRIARSRLTSSNHFAR